MPVVRVVAEVGLEPVARAAANVDPTVVLIPRDEIVLDGHVGQRPRRVIAEQIGGLRLRIDQRVVLESAGTPGHTYSGSLWLT